MVVVEVSALAAQRGRVGGAWTSWLWFRAALIPCEPPIAVMAAVIRMSRRPHDKPSLSPSIAPPAGGDSTDALCHGDCWSLACRLGGSETLRLLRCSVFVSGIHMGYALRRVGGHMEWDTVAHTY